VREGAQQLGDAGGQQRHRAKYRVAEKDVGAWRPGPRRIRQKREEYYCAEKTKSPASYGVSESRDADR
jgi:hypothetical protein